MKPIKLTEDQMDSALEIPRDDRSRHFLSSQTHKIILSRVIENEKAFMSPEEAYALGRVLIALAEESRKRSQAEKPELTHVEKTLLGALK